MLLKTLNQCQSCDIVRLAHSVNADCTDFFGTNCKLWVSAEGVNICDILGLWAKTCLQRRGPDITRTRSSWLDCSSEICYRLNSSRVRNCTDKSVSSPVLSIFERAESTWPKGRGCHPMYWALNSRMRIRKTGNPSQIWYYMNSDVPFCLSYLMISQLVASTLYPIFILSMAFIISKCNFIIRYKQDSIGVYKYRL